MSKPSSVFSNQQNILICEKEFLYSKPCYSLPFVPIFRKRMKHIHTQTHRAVLVLVPGLVLCNRRFPFRFQTIFTCNYYLSFSSSSFFFVLSSHFSFAEKNTNSIISAPEMGSKGNCVWPKGRHGGCDAGGRRALAMSGKWNIYYIQ